MKQLWHTVAAFILLSIITGIIYPMLVLLIGQKVFPYQANGSLIVLNNQVVGSELIGQKFISAKYFWSRPSASTGYDDNPLVSGGSNLSPSNPDLLKAIQGRVAALDATSEDPVPIDLVTASASGVDPDISVAAAYFQMERVARARGISLDVVQTMINQHAQMPLWGIWGEAIVNVLNLNLALDHMQGKLL